MRRPLLTPRRRLGKTPGAITQVRQAAEVLVSVNKPFSQLNGFLDRAQHLAAIHKLPESLWPTACEWLASKGGTVKAVEERVKAAMLRAYALHFDPGLAD